MKSYKAFDRQQKCGPVFIDLSTAYDTVSKYDFLAKLSQIIPPTKFISLIWNILSNRTVTVRHGGGRSKGREE